MAIYCSSFFTLNGDLPLHEDTANGRAAAGEPTWSRGGLVNAAKPNDPNQVQSYKKNSNKPIVLDSVYCQTVIAE